MTAVTKIQDTERAGWRGTLDKIAPDFQDALPEHVTLERFKRIVASAIGGDSYILRAVQDNPKTVWSACMACAKDGLIPDGREAALVAYKSKDGMTASYIPMVAGLLKLIRQSGQVASISAHVVHQNDDFEYVLGDEERIAHKPALSNRGAMIAAYAIIRTKDGASYRDLMTADEIAKVRAVSKAQNGPWNGPFVGEMWKKSVLRRLAKRAPISTDLMDVMTRDDHLTDFDRAERLVNEPRVKTLADLNRKPALDHEDVIDAEPDDLPKIPRLTSDGSDKQARIYAGAITAHLNDLGGDHATTFWLDHAECLETLSTGWPDLYSALAELYDQRCGVMV